MTRERPWLVLEAALLVVLLHANAPEVWFWFAVLVVVLAWRCWAWRWRQLQARAQRQPPAQESA